MELEPRDEWSERVGIKWWAESRKELNKVIRKYNNWVISGANNPVKGVKLLLKINNHLTRKYANQDGGSGYREELQEIKSHVSERLRDILKLN